MDKEAQSEEQTQVLEWGNLDKNNECKLPEKFDSKNNYFVKLWKTMKLRDGQVVVDRRSVKFQCYDEMAFEQSFGTTISKGQQETTPLIQKLGFTFKVLHNPNK